MDLDTIKYHLGGNWYDTWWMAIVDRFDPYPAFAYAWEPTFFELINEGWLEMYPQPKMRLNYD